MNRVGGALKAAGPDAVRPVLLATVIALFLFQPVAAGAQDAAGPPPADRPAATVSAAAGFRITGRQVLPRRTVPAATSPVKVWLRFSGARQPVAVRFRLRRSGRTVRRLVVGGRQGARPGRWYRVNWNGRTAGGKLAPAGSYVVVAGPFGGPFRRLRRFRLYSHLHPVAGPHGTRGPVGVFGAGRNGGRIHQGFDVTGACETPLLAVRSGRILKVANDPVLLGNHMVLKGEGEARTYLYAHLPRPAPVRKGQTVRAGRRIGAIGQTGNAASTPCHLHIEVRSRGRLLDPWPLLASWPDLRP